MPIQVLPDDVAAKIAAGEVVERPASVVKELLENSIDAGARDVRIEIREGGVRLIRIGDDGSGIPAAETETAFLRHATSKLRSATDLEHIHTLGFRGEALASIAAVSQLTLLSRTAAEEMGIRLRLEAGNLVQRSGQGTPIGTTLTVENLFYNIPARRKFLRSEATEAAHILTLVTRYALAWPDLRISLVRDGRLAFQSSGTGQMLDVLLKLYDLETTRQLLEFKAAEGGLAVWGYTSMPALNRGDRTHLSFFVNRRLVAQDRLLGRAVVDAYHGLLPGGRYPVTVLHLELDPGDVDVNVHPTKAEIRFRRSGDVFSLVQRTIRQTLTTANPVRSLGAAPQSFGPRSLDTQFWSDSRSSQPMGRQAMELQRTGESPVLPSPGEGHAPMSLAADDRPSSFPVDDMASRSLPPLRVLGQLGLTYIIAEGPAGLYLIDQHTAHERVLYERFRSEQVQQTVARQQLLDPLAVELPAVPAAALLEHLDAVLALGFELESFGGETLLVRAIPAILTLNEVEPTLTELAGRLTGEAGGSADDLFEEALLTLVCHSAVRAGKALSHDEMCDLLRQLEMTRLPHTCPHGRPIFLHLSTDRLAYAFGRT
jgi:DNA mismatch repair protein MutL